jgi:hypothetical protein
VSREISCNCDLFWPRCGCEGSTCILSSHNVGVRAPYLAAALLFTHFCAHNKLQQHPSYELNVCQETLSNCNLFRARYGAQFSFILNCRLLHTFSVTYPAAALLFAQCYAHNKLQPYHFHKLNGYQEILFNYDACQLRCCSRGDAVPRASGALAEASMMREHQPVAAPPFVRLSECAILVKASFAPGTRDSQLCVPPRSALTMIRRRE